MEEKQPKLLVKGVFDFDRKGVFYLLGLICGIAVVVLAVLSLVKVTIPYLDYILIGVGGLGILFGLIGWIGTLVAHKKALLVYEDHITFNAGGASFTENVEDILRYRSQGKSLSFVGKHVRVVDGIVNIEDVMYALDNIFAPHVLPADLSGPDLVFVNVAVEELRKARELYKLGLISEDELRQKKQIYMEATSKYYLVNGSLGAAKF